MKDFILLFIALFASCVTAEDFVCPEPYGFYPNPDNCIKYYQCSDDIAQELVCGLREFLPAVYEAMLRYIIMPPCSQTRVLACRCTTTR